MKFNHNHNNKKEKKREKLNKNPYLIENLFVVVGKNTLVIQLYICI